jgi:hypothetical protein
MRWPFETRRTQPTPNVGRRIHILQPACCCAIAALLLAGTTPAQITINSKTGVVTNGATPATTSQVDRRYQQIEPTHVALTKSELDPKTRLELIRTMQSEQGFAMRPFPRGHKGLTLEANGKLEPAGESYLNMATKEGLSAKPGDRLVLTDIRIEHSRIVFDLNGGPDPRHRFLQHIQIGTGPSMTPVTQGDDHEPTGARLSLTFENHVPELTGDDVKALLAPMISFGLKTPVQAFTDTLPPKLKEAILNHNVLVGMSTEMVLYAKGQPEGKSREMEVQMPFDEWIYGKPPKEVDFVRINGNRVIRVEIAKVGETPVIFTKNEVEGLMRTDGTPLQVARTVKEGDVERDPNTQAPAASPSILKPGEKIPDQPATGEMRPVRFPAPKPPPGDQSGAQPDATTPASQPANSQPAGVPAGPTATQVPPGDASQATPPKPPSPPPVGSSQPE